MLQARLKTADYHQMEATATVKAEVDEKEMDISQDCLALPTILRHLMQQFSTEELMTLSLVNKLWNFEARSVMRERGNVLANTASGKHPDDDICHKLIDLASDLENMRVVPFSGIYMQIFHRDTCHSISNDESLDRSYKSILNRLPWKRFAVRVCDDWQNYKNCPALALVKTILGNFCGVLEDLGIQCGREEFYKNAFQHQRLPCLKSLQVKPGDFEPGELKPEDFEPEDFNSIEEPLTSAFIQALVSRAPNLQTLYIEGEINLTENVLQGSSAVLVPTHTFCPLYEQVREDLVSSLRVYTMEICIQDAEMTPELLSTFIPMVLRASRTTLTYFCIDLKFAKHLSSYGICLQNVTTLRIHLNCCTRTQDKIESTILEDLPRRLDFARVFPKLSQATIFHVIDQGRSYIWLKYALASPLSLKIY